MHRPHRSRKNRRGAAMVELAICFPVLLMFLFGIIEFSRVLQLEHSIRLAAFEGARAGAALDASTADVQTAVNTILAAESINNQTTTITPNPIAYTSPTLTVTVSANPMQNAWVTWFVTSGNPITATITLDREIQAVSVP